ncbi:MAG: N-acetylmannosamine-6-phosphate 2-epimerase [bacterium]|nr:N-acetylmannosamine-6-phosphate 2-epimerase [bacterium]
MSLLERLRGGLIVSVQAWPGSAIDDPRVLAAMAAAAEANGAVGVRMQGVENLRAGRARVRVPIVGLIKREYAGFEPYITPTLREVAEVVESGAEIVAFDATERARPEGTSVEALVAAIHAAGCLAMADCATAGDALCAQAAGADIVGTTLCGYTATTQGASLPALAMVRECAELETFVICEGGVHRPEQLAEAIAAGADAVVVGTAITNTDWLVREFSARTAKERHR